MRRGFNHMVRVHCRRATQSDAQVLAQIDLPVQCFSFKIDQMPLNVCNVMVVPFRNAWILHGLKSLGLGFSWWRTVQKRSITLLKKVKNSALSSSSQKKKLISQCCPFQGKALSITIVNSVGIKFWALSRHTKVTVTDNTYKESSQNASIASHHLPKPGEGEIKFINGVKKPT